MLDLVNFWEVVVFSWITGNSATKWYDFIDISFLPFELKERCKEEIRERLGTKLTV